MQSGTEVTSGYLPLVKAGCPFRPNSGSQYWHKVQSRPNGKESHKLCTTLVPIEELVFLQIYSNQLFLIYSGIMSTILALSLI